MPKPVTTMNHNNVPHGVKEEILWTKCTGNGLRPGAVELIDRSCIGLRTLCLR